MYTTEPQLRSDYVLRPSCLVRRHLAGTPSRRRRSQSTTASRTARTSYATYQPTLYVLTSTLDLLPVGPKFTRSACRARARPRPQTRRPPLLLKIDGTDRRTDRRTDTRSFYDACRILCGPRTVLVARGRIAAAPCE